jgi:hypothetical protein
MATQTLLDNGIGGAFLAWAEVPRGRALGIAGVAVAAAQVVINARYDVDICTCTPGRVVSGYT